MKIIQPGPVQILCEEIKFRFHRSMERPDIFTAFVRQLVSVVADDRAMRSLLAGKVTTAPPSEGSAQVLEAAQNMFEPGLSIRARISRADKVHDLSRELNPEDAYPTDHLIDMLSGCASAIRFGLETPCRSRHAAGAADHIWGQRYGVRLFDEYTSNWRNDWARGQLQLAILSLSINASREQSDAG